MRLQGTNPVLCDPAYFRAPGSSRALPKQFSPEDRTDIKQKGNRHCRPTYPCGCYSSRSTQKDLSYSETGIASDEAPPALVHSLPKRWIPAYGDSYQAERKASAETQERNHDQKRNQKGCILHEK